ncbi:facilitated trehalose transporter Tret1 isoform X2 [Ooceraea biroi]|uniref:facilitated trehalose transporter Tret1 isoform X2 n=1 Tax=Ooceraea biroi TaxID=2015173 RepID=UPI0005B96B79|nr:facilitated trehalose transporter Tret1 isoform X2 [Ooceraea biroi]
MLLATPGPSAPRDDDDDDVSLPVISQIFGCLLSLITMKYGRRCSMVIANATCSLGWIVIASSYSVTQLFIGRMLTGAAIGICATAVPIYLEEISTPSWREFLTITPNTGLAFGVVIVYFLGFLMQDNWRLIATLCIIPPTLSMLFTIFFIPESPVWLLTKCRKEAARIALLRIRGLLQETVEFREEFAKMANYNEQLKKLESEQSCRSDVSSTEETSDESSSTMSVWDKLKSILRTICLPEVWKPLAILNFYFIFQQFSGVYVITAYAVDMIVNAKITMDPFLITVVIGIIEVVVTLIAACCSSRIGRRTISIVSGIGMSISLGALGTYMQFFEDASVAVLPLVCILVFVTFASFGFLVIPWAMIGELYPTKYVSVLGPLTTFFACVFNFGALQLYPTMVTQDETATIYFYCLISVVATFYLTIALPETRGKTKQQIEEAFRRNSRVKDAREISEATDGKHRSSDLFDFVWHGPAD